MSMIIFTNDKEYVEHDSFHAYRVNGQAKFGDKFVSSESRLVPSASSFQLEPASVQACSKDR